MSFQLTGPKYFHHRVVLVDDNFIIRHVLKTFLAKLEAKLSIDLQIASSEDGVQAVGYLFLLKPDIVIIDSTLPKYSGRELIEYIASNKQFSLTRKIIVLTEGKKLDLPSGYTVIDKRDWNFIDKLIDEVENTIREKNKLYIKEKFKSRLMYFAKNAVLWANRSDLLMNRIFSTVRILKLLLFLPWFIVQVIISLNLTVLRIFSTTPKDDNLLQSGKDLSKFRVRYYPTLVGIIVSVIILVLQLGLFIAGGALIFRVAEREQPVMAVNKNDFKVQRGTTTIAASSTTATITAGTDYTAPTAASKAFIRITNAHMTGAGRSTTGATTNALDTTAYISNASNITTSVTFTRAGTTNDTRIDWEIVEYQGITGGTNEIVVRGQGSVSVASAAATADTPTVSGVVTDADVVVFVTGQGNNDTGSTKYNTGLYTSNWIGASTVGRFTRGDSTAAGNVSYAVVEFTGTNWKIQRSEHTYTAAGSNETNTITAVNALSRTFMHVQKRSGTGLNGMDEIGANVSLTATTTVTFILQTGATTPASQTSVAWVIENTQTTGTPASVQRANFSRTNNTNKPGTLSQAITAVGDMTNTSVFINTRSSGTGTTYPQPMSGAKLTSTTNFDMWYSDGGTTINGRYEVVQWPTEVAETTVGTLGTQTSSIIPPSTAQYIGGAFKIVSSLGTRNVTSITIREQGTIDAANNLKNIKLFYESDTSSAYDCASESYAGTETQYGSTVAAGFDAANGVATFTGSVSITTTSAMCVYVVADVQSGALDADTIEVDISDPTTAVVVSEGNITPNTTVALAGTSTILAATTVGTLGTQTATLISNQTGQYVGGAFKIVSNSGTKNVTGITIREQGTIDASANLKNIKLFYESDITSAYDCASESYAGSETQFGSTVAAGFNAANGTAAFTGSVSITTTSTMCVYVVVDVQSGAAIGDTIEIDISAPSTAVTVSANGVGPTTAVAISGTSTVASAETVSALGAHITNANIPTTAQYFGGAIVIKSNTGTRNVTGITIAEGGTIDASANLKNIKLFYDSDTTSPYDCTGEVFNGTETQFGSTVTAGFSSANGTAAFTGSVSTSTTSTMCVYATGDIQSGASDSQTIDFEVTNPSTAVTVSAGSVGPTSAVGPTGTLTVLAAGSPSWYNASWVYRTPITINDSQVTGPINYLNYPVYFDYTDVRFKDTSNSGHVGLSTGDDILFTDYTGTVKLNHEILSYTASTGQVKGWVQIPTMFSSSNTTIYMYYGNAASGVQENIASTWSDFNAMWHFEEASGTRNDSTGHNNLTDNGTTPSSTGVLGSSANFNGTTQFFSITDANQTGLELNGDYTVSFYANFNNHIAGAGDGIMSKNNNTDFTNMYEFWWDWDTVSQNALSVHHRQASVGTTQYSNYGSSTLANSTWYLMNVIFNDANDTIVFCINGACNNPDSMPQTSAGNAQLFTLAKAPWQGLFFHGKMDEFRIQGATKTINWVATQYNNEITPGTFTTLGTETGSNAAPTVSTVSLNAGSSINLTEGTTTTVNLTATVTDTNTYSDITNVTGKMYRSGIAGAETCTLDNNNCYQNASCSLSGCSGNSCTATCAFSVQFHAEPTDAGTYSGQYWLGWVQATDAASATGTAFSPNNLTEMNTLRGLSITGTIAYGSLFPGDSSPSNQSITIKNTGNVSIDNEVSGTALTCTTPTTCGSSTVPIGNQQYKLTTFTYGTGTALTGSAVSLNISIAKPTAAPSNTSSIIYWSLSLPSVINAGTYSASNTITAVPDI